MIIREGLTFDDVLLVPKYSTVTSRSAIDLSVKWAGIEFDHPVIPANMQTITGFDMAVEVAKSGGLPVLHRFMPLEEQLNYAEDIIDMFGPQRLAVSIGVKDNDFTAAEKFLDVGVRMLCIDIAHGDSEQCTKMIKRLSEIDPKPLIIAGNVATGDGARRLWEAGASIIKVGIGPGSLCTTRIETGNGVPQLTALMDVDRVRKERLALLRTRDEIPTKRYLPIIADGGIKNAGDIVKALCFADMVMIGNVFAGCTETPGEIMSIEGRSYKRYVGSSTHKANHVEGVAAIVPTKGSYKEILEKLLEGVASGCSYQGVHNLEKLRDNPEFIRITGAGLRESHPHDVMIR